jgi:hypothetical protein
MNVLGDGAIDNPFAPFINGMIGNIGSLLFSGEENCLFLDVSVPGRLIREPSAKKVPVVNWITGGAVSRLTFAGS